MGMTVRNNNNNTSVAYICTDTILWIGSGSIEKKNGHINYKRNMLKERGQIHRWFYHSKIIESFSQLNIVGTLFIMNRNLNLLTTFIDRILLLKLKIEMYSTSNHIFITRYYMSTFFIYCAILAKYSHSLCHSQLSLKFQGISNSLPNDVTCASCWFFMSVFDLKMEVKWNEK